MYGETKNGIQVENTYRQFEVDVDPFVIPGDSSRGLIKTIQQEKPNTIHQVNIYRV